MHRGYVKIWRKMLDNPVLNNPRVLKLWIIMLIMANHKPKDEMFAGKRFTCQAGQFTTGRLQLSKRSGISPSSIERILKKLEIEQQIEQRKATTSRLITITSWNKYQNPDSKSNNDRTATGQRPDTLKECKNDKNVKKILKSCIVEKNKRSRIGSPTILILKDLNNLLGSKYRDVDKTVRLIERRMKEGYTVEDFFKVHRIKVGQWKDDVRMRKFLRPETLYSNKFEGYVNEPDMPDGFYKQEDVTQHNLLVMNEIKESEVKEC